MAADVNETAVVGVVTVSFHSREVLEPFLRSVTAASAGPIRTVVADNVPGGDPDARAAADAAGAGYVSLEGNPGYGAAMNGAVRTLPAEVEWVLVSNPDVTLGAGSIDTLIATGAADARIGSVGPRIISDGEVYPSARAVPSLRIGIGHAMLGGVLPRNRWTRVYHAADDELQRRDAGWLSGACVLVRRSAFESVGGFDEGYFMYFEDVDLGFRLGRAGFRNVYEPDAVIEHTGAHSTAGRSRQMVIAHHESARRFLMKKYPGPLLAPLRGALSLGLRLRAWWTTQRLDRAER